MHGSINGLSASLDGIQLIVATDKGYIFRMRVSDFSKMLLCENHTEPVLDVFYMPGVSDKFSTCSEDGTVRLWDSNDYSVISRCAIVSAVGIHPNVSLFTDEVMITGWNDGKVRAFKIEGSSPLWEINNAHKNGVTAICLSYNFKFVCSGGGDGEVRIWEVRSREMVSHLKEHTAKVTKLQIFPDDIHLLSSARDKAILCWDLKNEKRVAN
jgi:WD40 repeat protein